MRNVKIAKTFGSEIKELMGLIRSTGKECYIVGGAVRDFLLGHKAFVDIDLTTSLSVESLIKIFKQNKMFFFLIFFCKNKPKTPAINTYLYFFILISFYFKKFIFINLSKNKSKFFSQFIKRNKF